MINLSLKDEIRRIRTLIEAINGKPLIKEDTESGSEGFPMEVTYRKFYDDEIEEDVYEVWYETNYTNGHEKEWTYDDIEYYLGSDMADMIGDGEGKDNGDGTFTIDQGENIDLNNVESVNDIAKKIFGETWSFSLAGYLLTDGTLLDFSQGQGTRTADHRSINMIDGMDMYKFINLGNIRMMPESPGITLSQKPTYEQKQKLSMFISKYGRRNGYFYMDVIDTNGDNIWNKEYDYPYAEIVLDDIDMWFDSGISPNDKDNDENY